ncbi:PREDICTED: ubiquitin carboxyl-terminal hydrolase 16 isoform X2 [Nanorana parkeri]|uniref:ubiquitin carboxyl-terminal hydrolase 16 isoform X2 n=1 Tax=Nanorana parkeri TaxID=125878 RepID=UPI000853F273|nr:PREDICTED: ubiquitin carboxyl-terminal hydrolase 16 isoform X2 [Nanorana parkeri]
MVKKKGRNLPAPEPVDTEPTCKHIRKGLDDGAVKRALVNVDWTLCQDCQSEAKEKTNNEEEEQTEAQMIWLCMKCGHRGCGRYSEHQHALNHYNTPRSEPHCLVLSVGEWNAWCYLCDEEIQYSSSGRLRQLVDFIQKKSKTNVKISNTVQSGQDDRISENKQEKEEHQVVEDPNRVAKGAKAVNTLNDNKEVTVKGLSNLGNTCFFNAVMQNLSQTPTLRELLNDVKHPGRTVTVQVPDDSRLTPREVTLEQQPGPLTLAMWQFLTEMQETKKGVVTPKELFSQVCKKAVRFRGYQQQDSQELLRYLLDGMRGEEIQRVSSAFSKTLQAASEKIEDEDVKKIVRDCEKRRVIPNFVDRVFGGEMTSTIMCETCHTVSLVHEPFLDLSLPVLDDTPAKKNTAKSAKAVQEKKNEGESDNDSYVKDRHDVPSGPSKHLQKKAKKQAKKQAKSQRRQQKMQDKTLPLNDPNVSSNDDEGFIPDNNNVLDNNCEQQDMTPADGQCSSITSDVDMEKKEDLGHLENKEPSQTDMANNAEASSKSLESQHNSATEDQENSHDLGQRSLHQIELSLENEDHPSSEVSAVLENGDDNQGNIDSDEMEEERSQSPQADHDPVDSQLTENLNRLNLSSDPERINLSSDLEPNDIEIQIIDEAPPAQIYEVVNQDPSTAFCTLTDRRELQLDELSVLSCLYQFTRKEDLVGNNQLLCNTCTQRQAKTIKHNNKEKKFVYTNAKKQMLVSAPPPILTLHLKRFQQNGFNLHKINKHIKFPEVIDLAPFSTVKCKSISEGEDRLLYSLYGVIEHSGTMRSGHYTAYVKSRTPNPRLCNLVLQGVLPEVPSTESTKGHWFHISDSHVQAVPLNKVLNSQAYLLFYERIL